MSKILLLFCSLFALFCTHAQAEDSSDYFTAKKSIENGGDISLYSHLASHPLYPDLAARFYRKHLDRDEEITTLFQRYYSARPIKNLHNKWIEKKFNDSDYPAIVKNYYATGSQKAECAYRSSQLIMGNRDEALNNIYWTWMTNKSVSSLCDSVFSAWGGAFDPDNRVKRTKLAYHAGNTAFAQQLAEKLPFDNPERSTLLQFAQYYQHPEMLLTSLPSELTRTELARELLPLALSQLVRIDSSEHAPFALQFSEILKKNNAYQTMLGKLTEYLAKRKDPQAKQSYALMAKPDKSSTEAITRYLAVNQDWQAIQHIIKPHNSSAMALYWLARATEARGNDATEIYRKAAQDRSYYGFLAADKIKAPYLFNKEKILVDTSAQTNLNKHTELKRAKLLAQYGEPIEARREIIHLAQKMSPYQRRQLAVWLSNNRFHFETIYILGQAKDWNDIDIRFPTPYNSAVKHASAVTGVHATWIYAITRQESSMNPLAYSRAKAQGLMQLIPSTARLMARQQGLSSSGDGIYNPITNTQLGAAYLANMFSRYNNMAMASAAYNAGPGRVDRWMAHGTTDMTIWVEKIPFQETRKYVKNILEYQQVYAKHLGVTIPSITKRLAGHP